MYLNGIYFGPRYRNCLKDKVTFLYLGNPLIRGHLLPDYRFLSAWQRGHAQGGCVSGLQTLKSPGLNYTVDSEILVTWLLKAYTSGFIRSTPHFPRCLDCISLLGANVVELLSFGLRLYDIVHTYEHHGNSARPDFGSLLP